MTQSGHLQFKTDWSIYTTMKHQTPVQSPRGRPRGFDTEAAVERAMGVFWSRGYHGTALPDLLRATKLSRGSLYAAFGGKHALFLRALDRYIADALARIDVEFGPRRAPVEGLRAFLSGYVERTSGGDGDGIGRRRRRSRRPHPPFFQSDGNQGRRRLRARQGRGRACGRRRARE